MPKLVKELTEGVGYSYSSENGQIAASQPRVFRVILNDPNELINIEDVCGVRIGDELRPGAKLYCTSFDARYESQSRLVLLCTFQFRTTADAASSGGGADPKSQPPDVRPPNWTTSTSLVEEPVNRWFRRRAQLLWENTKVPAVNPVGDIYDGVTRLVPIVSISITVHAVTDPTTDNRNAGKINRNEITLGSLEMKPHTLLFRGVQCQPVVEAWGGQIYRGWTATYEFAYKSREEFVTFPNDNIPRLVELGWDIAVPVTGFNCRAFDPANAAADEDVFGQPLKHENNRIQENPALPDNITQGDRVRAMVKVFEYEDGGASQAPSASPVALKENGRPLKTHDANGNLVNEPIVQAYAIQSDMNFSELNGGRSLFQ